MRSLQCVLAIAILLVCSVSAVFARDLPKDISNKRVIETHHTDPSFSNRGLRTLETAAAADTFCIVWYDFEMMDWQGWTKFDGTAQIDTFFHVDDFNGLDGGNFGRLVPIEGTKSLWCGIRPGSDDYLCSWISAPGYGYAWRQICCSDAIYFSGVLVWSFKCVVDSEPYYDFTYVEYDAGDGNWVEIEHYHGVDTLVAEHHLHLTQAATKLRYRFVSDTNTDDEDGLLDTDGAIIVDSITVKDDNGVIDYEDFESYPSMAKGELGIWNTTVQEAYGTFSALANNLIDKDPCAENFSTQVIFFNGSPYPSADYPGLFNTPFCSGPGSIEDPCQGDYIFSPIIDMLKYSTACDETQDAAIPAADAEQLGGAILGFDAYRDLPLENLVFYFWGFHSYDESGCRGKWMDRAFFFGPDKDYISHQFDVTDLVNVGLIQFGIGAVDMCPYWYGYYGDCVAHTPSPYIDNIHILRYKTDGPVWRAWQTDLFHDTFPEDNDASMNPMEDICRADAWFDSCAVTCTAPLTSGLDTLSSGEARVYCHVNVQFLGTDGKPDIAGASLEGTYGSYVSDDGDWTILLCEPAIDPIGRHVINSYCVDLNDSLFTRGYMIEYYFKAWDLDGMSSTLPDNAEESDGDRYEFTCLPTLRQVPGVLYCDNYNYGGPFGGICQTYYDPAFEAVTPAGEPLPDRYDVYSDISAMTSVVDGSSILCQAYHTVIHDSGDKGYMSDGSDHEWQNDAQLLLDWLNVTEHKVGLLIMGENVAYGFSTSASVSALELMSTTCGVSLNNSSYYNMTGGREVGGVVNPLITGVNGSPYDGLSYYSQGGCPAINDFDVLGKTAHGEFALQYPDYNSLQYFAGIFTDQLNYASQPLRTVWVGHSFSCIRNAANGTLARNEFLKMTYEFFELGLSLDITDTKLPKAYSLEQNFPNPFNPSTRISFTLPVKGHVSLKIYNVAGQLVRTLQDGVMDAGHHELAWNGSNNLGSNVASGVYFYKINAGDNYENVKKMVLLR